MTRSLEDLSAKAHVELLDSNAEEAVCGMGNNGSDETDTNRSTCKANDDAANDDAANDVGMVAADDLGNNGSDETDTNRSTCKANDDAATTTRPTTTRPTTTRPRRRGQRRRG